ncbi:hypothetical protein [Larkinella punicea]|uniref:Uncharacterized protein n=1 Tax=Larkinella punicea TaxID=2315727 RepID=A0A368JS42_9BACT|nr:hypothetical protein [Larkinella punicea]RCR69423.1 hypothetical protein DUE52_11260 [Larkinella punicea]
MNRPRIFLVSVALDLSFHCQLARALSMVDRLPLVVVLQDPKPERYLDPNLIPVLPDQRQSMVEPDLDLLLKDLMDQKIRPEMERAKLDLEKLMKSVNQATLPRMDQNPKPFWKPIRNRKNPKPWIRKRWRPWIRNQLKKKTMN